MTDTPEQTTPAGPNTGDVEYYLELALSSLSTALRGLLRIAYAGGRAAVLAELAAGRTLAEAKAGTDDATSAVYTPPTEPPRETRAAMAAQPAAIR